MADARIELTATRSRNILEANLADPASKYCSAVSLLSLSFTPPLYQQYPAMSEPAQGSTMRQRTAAPVSASASAGSSGSASSPRTSTPSSPHRSETQAYPVFAGEVPWAERSFLYQWRPFRGAWFDLKRRAPFYWSDWTEAARPRNLWTVAQSVPRMYFIK